MERKTNPGKEAGIHAGRGGRASKDLLPVHSQRRRRPAYRRHCPHGIRRLVWALLLLGARGGLCLGNSEAREPHPQRIVREH